MKKALTRISVISSLLIIGTVFASIGYFTYSTGQGLTDGTFFSDNVTGNAGKVDLTAAGLMGANIIGTVGIEAIGTGVFSSTQITPPIIGNPTTTCWKVSGTISTNNAGDISLDNVMYNPLSRQLEGTGFNVGLGSVRLGDGTYCSLANPTLADTMIAGTGAAFIGKVKILGSISSNDIFNIDSSYSVGEGFNFTLMNQTTNTIKKSISLLTRNVSPNSFSSISPVHVNNIIFFKDTGSSSPLLHYNDFLSSNVDTIVIMGGDLLIDTDIGDNLWSKPKVIIALKNDNGAGGNIFVTKSVTKLKSSIFTEGTIYSGEGTGAIYNDTAIELTDLPKNQLYVFGSILSHNTIGGSSHNPIMCPYSGTCTNDMAAQYDLNTFRNYDSTDSGALRGYKDSTLDKYSLVIEYDARVMSDPPPGLSAN